jgi:hypothetical protein
MWRNFCRPASAIAVVALLVLAGCGGGDETTSADAVATATPTTVATTVLATTTTVGTATTVALRCNDVTFTSNSDDVARDIRATGLSCEEAEALVGKIGPQVSSVGAPSRVESDGFVCNRLSTRSGDHGPALSTFECTSGATKVIFVAPSDVSR